MNIQELDQQLPIVGGRLTLSTSSLGGLLASFLIEDNAGQPLVVDGAAKRVTDTAVIVDGTTSYLNVANAPTHAVFTLGPDGGAVAVLTIALPPTWKFSTSFPKLPLFTEQRATSVNLLDALVLTNPSFVVATAALTDTSGAPLVPGLNFVAHFDPTGVAGLFATLLGGSPSYLLHGTIALPQPTEATPPLPPRRLPWEATWPVPGIDLQAPLGIDVTLGSLRIDQAVWRTYSPTDAGWLASNPTYEPLLAVTATLAVPSASIFAVAAAVVLLDEGTAIFDCDFAGVTIGRLADLADLVNGPDLDTILPAEISSAIAAVAVEWASIAFHGSFSAAAVQYVSLKVGLPNLSWDVLPGVFTIGNLGSAFIVSAPFTSARALSVSLSGTIEVAGVSLGVVTQYPGFATLATGSASIPLRQIFDQLAPELPPPPDLTVDLLQLVVIPGQQYSFSVRTADDPGWTLDLGPVPMTIGSATVDVWNSGTGLQGTFTGTLEFDDAIETSIRYDIPGSFVLRADFPGVKLSEIVARLDEIGVTVPAGFDLELAQSYVLIAERSGGDLTFSLGALVDQLGLVAFTAEKSGGRWGYAVGVELYSGGLSSIPGLEPLAEIESFVGLDKIFLLVSSLTDPGFTFPDMAAFAAPALQGQTMRMPPMASGVVRGVNVYAQLSAGRNQGFVLLAQYLHISLDGTVGLIIAISAPDPTSNSRLVLAVGLDLDHTTRIDGELGVLVQGGEFGVFLAAVVTTSIQGQPARFSVTAVVVPTGVLITGTMQGSITFDPVTLGNVAIAIGINDAGIPSFGFAATLDVADFESSIAVFFDSTDPAKSMLAGSISDVTLLSVATSIAGQEAVPSPLDEALAMFGLRSLQAFSLLASVAPALDERDVDAIRSAFAQGGVSLPGAFDQIFFVVNTPGSVWHLTDLSTMVHYELRRRGSEIEVSLQPQIYLAPQTTFIGTLRYPPGIHVIAEIDYCLVKARIKVLIDARVGIAVDVSAAPIEIVSSNFFAVTGGGADGGPLLSLATYEQRTQADPMLRPPHFLLSGALRILGADAAGIYVSIGASGLQFAFRKRVAVAVDVDLRGSVSTGLALAIGGGATVDIDQTFDGGARGRIHVTTTVECSLDIGADAGGARATVQGRFEFQGSSLAIPPVALDVTTEALANLPATLWEQIVDVLDKLLLDSSQWLRWVADGIVEGAGQTAAEVGHVLGSVYHLAGDAIAGQTQSILHYAIDGVTQALEGAGYTARETAAILTDAGYAAAEVAHAIEDVFSGGAHVDFTMGHADVPAGPHVDRPATHVDTPGAPHVDTGSAPHVDVPKVHTDTRPHTDVKTGFHTDFRSRHVDKVITPHNDRRAYPHVDTAAAPHVDTEVIPHTDGPVTPHVDTGTHVDT